MGTQIIGKFLCVGRNYPIGAIQLHLWGRVQTGSFQLTRHGMEPLCGYLRKRQALPSALAATPGRAPKGSRDLGERALSENRGDRRECVDEATYHLAPLRCGRRLRIYSGAG